jgi:hypothetical protein
MPVAVDTSGRIYDDFLSLLFLHAHREASALANDIPESFFLFYFFSSQESYTRTHLQIINNKIVALYHLCLLLLVRLGGYIVNLSDFYSYSLIGKLTAFLQLQEFSLRNMIVTSLSLQEHILTHHTHKHLVY